MGFDFTEKDSCGVGFIASRGLPPTHGMTLKILECLSNLDHRGAKFADGTGDGAGVLTEIPAPSPVPSANLAPLWSRFERHSNILRVIP